MEALAIIYILIGSATIGIMHYKRFGEEYKEKLPVIFRMDSLRRWLVNSEETNNY